MFSAPPKCSLIRSSSSVSVWVQVLRQHDPVAWALVARGTPVDADQGRARGDYGDGQSRRDDRARPGPGASSHLHPLAQSAATAALTASVVPATTANPAAVIASPVWAPSSVGIVAIPEPPPSTAAPTETYRSADSVRERLLQRSLDAASAVVLRCSFPASRAACRDGAQPAHAVRSRASTRR